MGRLTSLWILPPAVLSARGIDSRTCQNVWESCRELAMAASVISPSSNAPSKMCSIMLSWGFFSRESSTSTFQGESLSGGTSISGRYFLTRPIGKSLINSKAVREEPAFILNRFRSFPASWILFRQQKAVSFSFAAGKSFRTTAVIMPIVPSLPKNKSLKSYPVLSLRRRLKPL